jgi:hypothetical protein
MSAQYSANQQLRVVRRYFVGTTEVRHGQIICYQENASETDADPKLRLGSAVEAINSDNAAYVAGFVPLSEAGKTGPCFIELVVPAPGDIFDAEVDGTTDVAVGDGLEPDATLGALIDGSEAAGDVLFRALEAFATDATKSAIKVYKI